MNPRHPLALALAVLAALATLCGATRAAGSDDANLQLATTSGCMTCHQIEPAGKGPDGLAPIGPAWKDVAARYRGQKDAADKLTRRVVVGSNPYDAHWKGKVSGLAMPANAVTLKEADAKQLVKWILTMDRVR